VTSAICAERTTCRICGGSDLRSVIDLGDQYIASAFWGDVVPPELSEALPVQVVRCAAPGGCGLVQLRHTVAPHVLYHDYGYRSGTNEMMRQNLRDLVAQIEASIPLRNDDVVLDIGCNDGTLLESYRTPGVDRVGIDPSVNVAATARAKGIHVENDFFSAAAFQRARPGRRARVVTSIAMFYDLDEPNTFAADVRAILADDGIWAIELSYLPFMLERRSFDTICHEHLEYYALRQLEWIARQQNMQIHRLQFNDVNGGSIRVFIRHVSAGPPAADDQAELERVRQREKILRIDEEHPYAEFRQAVAGVRLALGSLIEQLRRDGQRVHAYGASTKGNTLLQYCGLDHHAVTKAAERNPEKWGKRTPGTLIPIVSEADARSERPDYFLVLPWPFFPVFVEREREFLERGGKFIVPLPELRVVGAADV
jgi:NDP-4-keto-2,6-dideoxyhexose 3-C-methyltransferase